MQIFLTGANGFIGRALCAEALSRGFKVQGVTRAPSQLPKGAINTVVESFETCNYFSDLLADCDVVVHLAACVHVMNKSISLYEYRRVNVEGTLNLARQAAAVGVKRFIFMSSIKVNGEFTELGATFTAYDKPAPLDAYGISKMEGEQGLQAIAMQSGMEVVIIRAPLVYGPGAKANFAVMLAHLSRGIPLPLGAIANKRSFVALDNLLDLILICFTHPAAANNIFLVSDGEDISTTELLRRLGRCMDKLIWLIPVPVGCLEFFASILGKHSLAKRLCGSLQVDIEKTRRELGWSPPLTLDQGIKKVVDGLKK